MQNAKVAFTNIEKMLYSTPAVLNVLKASVRVETFQAVFTNEQKSKLANGTLKLMTKKDGTLMANLVNPETKKIVSSISLKSVKNTPEISQAMTSFATQMQMAQIAEQIQLIQVAVEEVRQGLEYDRLATAYSCQQKLLQAMSMKTPELKTMALLRVASDAEDSRNLLMLSQNANLTFIKNQPESFWENSSPQLRRKKSTQEWAKFEKAYVQLTWFLLQKQLHIRNWVKMKRQNKACNIMLITFKKHILRRTV